MLSDRAGRNADAAFDYDFERRRLAKTSDSTALTYAYDGSRVINEFSNTGKLVNRYDWGELGRSSQLGPSAVRMHRSAHFRVQGGTDSAKRSQLPVNIGEQGTSHRKKTLNGE
ncbi:MAG: hypothetical protein ACREDR_25625 [Blastocatellia bacterium]